MDLSGIFGAPHRQESPPLTEVIAPGFTPHPELNLHDRHGKVITDLVYTNFYVGGSAWSAQDRDNIDNNLAKAMSDQELNNVLVQYFRGTPRITSTFRPSTLLPGAAPDSISQPEVEQLLLQLNANGKLGGFDFQNTVFNFLLPRGVELTLDDGSGNQAVRASSLEGLGGFHGSVRTGATRIYYSVGVFSEGNNGIVAFNDSWKNVVATFYHELVEARHRRRCGGGVRRVGQQ
jgi:hypothetical protein